MERVLDRNEEEEQILFVGSLNCIRHKPFSGFGELMQAGRAAFLCPSMSDFASGRYIRQIAEAVAELARERDARRVVIVFGCQWVILSTDEAMLRDELETDLGILVEFRDDSHLEGGDHS